MMSGAAWKYPRDTDEDVRVQDWDLEAQQAAACSNNNDAHTRPVCNAKALWDLYDRRPPLVGGVGALDDDPISGRSFLSIGTILRSYPRGCVNLWPLSSDNNCANEGSISSLNSLDKNGPNIWDFHANFDNWSNSADVARFETILNSHNLEDGDRQ